MRKKKNLWHVIFWSLWNSKWKCGTLKWEKKIIYSILSLWESQNNNNFFLRKRRFLTKSSHASCLDKKIKKKFIYFCFCYFQRVGNSNCYYILEIEKYHFYLKSSFIVKRYRIYLQNIILFLNSLSLGTISLDCTTAN